MNTKRWRTRLTSRHTMLFVRPVMMLTDDYVNTRTTNGVSPLFNHDGPQQAPQPNRPGNTTAVDTVACEPAAPVIPDAADANQRVIAQVPDAGKAEVCVKTPKSNVEHNPKTLSRRALEKNHHSFNQFGPRACRICLGEDDDDTSSNSTHDRRGGKRLSRYDNPLVAPCECKGSMKWVHLMCLRTWMAGRLNIRDVRLPPFFLRTRRATQLAFATSR